MTRWIVALLASAALSASETALAANITSVSITGAPANPTISVSGSGFGTAPPQTFLGFPGFTGYDYGQNLYLTDLSTAHAFDAGGDAGINLRDLIGLVLLSYTDTQVVFQLGSDYSGYYYPNNIYALDPGDPFRVVIRGTSFNGTVGAPTVTPEPASIVTLLTGLASTGVLVSRRRRALSA
jgi:hypothetical protein